jgi:protein involved in polysaccharide export with SLBB domain
MINFIKKMMCLGTIIAFIVILGCSSSSTTRNIYNRDFLLAQITSAGTVPEYQLGFGDVVEVKFFNNERFNETVTVRPDGRITMEKVGDIFVTGMTPSRLDSLITATYADIIRDPDVTVIVRSFGGYQAFVLGEVTTPGGYPIERDLSLVQLLASAGGIKNTAALSSIMILRQGKNKEVSALKIDITDYLDGEQIHVEMGDKGYSLSMNEFLIQPRDIVYVPKTGLASTVAFLEQVYAGLLPPVDVYLRALLWSK